MISEKKKWHGAWFYASDIDWIVKVSVLYQNEWGEGLKTRGINDVSEYEGHFIGRAKAVSFLVKKYTPPFKIIHNMTKTCIYECKKG